MSDPLELARSLEARERVLADAALELSALEAETASIRTRAADTARFLAKAPDERKRLAAAVSDAGATLEAKQADEHAAAERLADAERSGPDDKRRTAEHALVAARDAAAGARRRAAELEGEARGFEDQVAAAQNERDALTRAASAASSALRATGRVASPEPAAGLEGVESWAAAIRSALFVARGALQRQREGLVREASELAAGVFGEPAYAASPALVRERLERARAQA